MAWKNKKKPKSGWTWAILIILGALVLGPYVLFGIILWAAIKALAKTE